MRLNVTLRRDKKEHLFLPPVLHPLFLSYKFFLSFSSLSLFTYFLRKVKRFISLRGSARWGSGFKGGLVSPVDKLSGTLPFDFRPLSPQFRTLHVLASLCPFLLLESFPRYIIIAYIFFLSR